MGMADKNAADASALLHSLCQQPGVQLAAPEHNGWEVFHQLLRSAERPHYQANGSSHGWLLIPKQLAVEIWGPLAGSGR